MHLKDFLQTVLLEYEEALHWIDVAREYELDTKTAGERARHSLCGEERGSYVFRRFLLRGLHRRIE